MPTTKSAVTAALAEFQNAVGEFATAVFKIQSGDAVGAVAAAASAEQRLQDSWRKLRDGFRGSKIPLADLDRLSSSLTAWIRDGWAFLPLALVPVHLPLKDGEPECEIRLVGNPAAANDAMRFLLGTGNDGVGVAAKAAVDCFVDLMRATPSDLSESWAVSGDGRPRLLEEPRPVSKLALSAWAVRSPMAIAATLVHLHESAEPDDALVPSEAARPTLSWRAARAGALFEEGARLLAQCGCSRITIPLVYKKLQEIGTEAGELGTEASFKRHLGTYRQATGSQVNRPRAGRTSPNVAKAAEL